MYDSIDDVVWLREQIEYQKTMRIDLSRLNAKLIAKLEKKNSKQKKQIAALVEKVTHLEEDNLKWIGAFAGYGKTINELREELDKTPWIE